MARPHCLNTSKSVHCIYNHIYIYIYTTLYNYIVYIWSAQKKIYTVEGHSIDAVGVFVNLQGQIHTFGVMFALIGKFFCFREFSGLNGQYPRSSRQTDWNQMSIPWSR